MDISKKTIIGIDYSLSCPAICKVSDDFLSSEIHFLTSNEKHTGKYGNITGHLHDDWNTFEHRYENLATWTLLTIQSFQPITHVYIEDYAFAAKGKVFSIGENTGLMKYFLYKHSIPFTLVAPTVLKKFFTKNGTANKDKMYDAFVQQTGIDLYQKLYLKRGKKVQSPISDIVDSFSLALYGQQTFFS